MASHRRANPAELPAEPPEVEVLRQATKGLEYPSESDAPFTVDWWSAGDSPNARDQLALRSKDGERAIAEVSPNRFFQALEGTDDAARFSELRQTVETHLRGLKVFRVGSGEVKVDVYLVGRGRTGEWLMLHTTSVET